jgi:hypothetical protein
MDAGSEAAFRSTLTGQSPPEIEEASLVLFGVESKKSTVIWKGKTNASNLSGIEWLPGTDRAIISSIEKLRTEDPSRPTPMRETIQLLDAEHAIMKPIVSEEVDELGGLLTAMVSPSKPFAILVSRDEPAAMAPATATLATGTPQAASATPSRPFTYRILDADGNLGRVMKVEAPTPTGDWSEDGACPIFRRMERTADRKRIDTYFKLHLESGQLEQLAKWTHPQLQARALPLSAALEQAKLVREGKERLVRTAVLMGSAENTRTMIAADCTAVELSPALNAVAYISDGVALVRPIVQIPRKAFLFALAQAEKDQLMMNAKQVGLATLMYGADYDDVIPGSGANMSDLLGPYAKNGDIFSGFNYTFGGGLLTDIKDPAKTALGYIQGSSGQAVVYADGHVEWVPNP